MTKASKRILVIALSIGLCLFGISVWQVAYTINFVRTAPTATGVIVDHHVTVQKENNRTKTHHFPIIRFETADGRKITFISDSGSEGTKAEIGQPRDLYYSLEDPNIVVEASFVAQWIIPLIPGLIGLPFLLTGLVALGSAQKKRKREQILFQTGRSVDALITEVKLSRELKENDDIPWQIFAQWDNPATSQSLMFESDCIWFDPTPHIKTQTVKVYFQPNDPEQYVMDTRFLPKNGK